MDVVKFEMVIKVVVDEYIVQMYVFGVDVIDFGDYGFDYLLNLVIGLNVYVIVCYEDGCSQRFQWCVCYIRRVVVVCDFGFFSGFYVFNFMCGGIEVFFFVNGVFQNFLVFGLFQRIVWFFLFKGNCVCCFDCVLCVVGNNGYIVGDFNDILNVVYLMGFGCIKGFYWGVFVWVCLNCCMDYVFDFEIDVIF